MKRKTPSRRSGPRKRKDKKTSASPDDHLSDATGSTMDSESEPGPESGAKAPEHMTSPHSTNAKSDAPKLQEASQDMENPDQGGTSAASINSGICGDFAHAASIEDSFSFQEIDSTGGAVNPNNGEVTHFLSAERTRVVSDARVANEGTRGPDMGASFSKHDNLTTPDNTSVTSPDDKSIPGEGAASGKRCDASLSAANEPRSTKAAEDQALAFIEYRQSVIENIKKVQRKQPQSSGVRAFIRSLFLCPDQETRKILRVLFLKSKDTLYNLALADPSEFKCHPDFQTIQRVNGRYAQSFFIVGTVTFSELTSGRRGRQICVSPALGFWQRAACVLYSICGYTSRAIRFGTYKDGVNFSSKLKFETPQSSEGDSEPEAPPKATGSSAWRPALNGHTHGPAPRPWDENVPTFDATQKFKRDYTSLPRITTELAVGDVVFVIFTAKMLGEDKKIMMNVQVVLKLLDASTSEDRETPPNPLPQYLRSLDDFGLEGDIYEPELEDEGQNIVQESDDDSF
ncbi:hypothetical protein BDZ89DRAFT_1047493 [Hymenopellis radicata]|nr:hypothetical protein BDZ89DRAFT_1047493 [Hymenopellis radicata]